MKAAPATVYAFFATEERWLLWQGIDATVDPRPGGVFRMQVRPGQVASGQFLEVVPERRLVFTWGWEDPAMGVPPGSSTVEVDFLPHPEGTLLRLRHTGLPAPMLEPHREGWQRYTHRLLVVAEGGDPGPDSD